MTTPRFKVRTLLIAVALLAMGLELFGLGQRSRRYAAEASRAAELERSSLLIAHDAEVYRDGSLVEAKKIETSDPARAAQLRLNAERLTRGIPVRKDAAIRAAKARAVYERAFTHPWETPPQVDDRLYATPASNTP